MAPGGRENHQTDFTLPVSLKGTRADFHGLVFKNVQPILLTFLLTFLCIMLIFCLLFTQGPLEAFVMVRIHAGQPIFLAFNHQDSKAPRPEKLISDFVSASDY
jgi:hypothetical protein